MTVVDEAKSGDLSAVQFNALGMSDMGRVRKNNEDNLVLRDLTTGESASPPARGPQGRPFFGGRRDGRGSLWGSGQSDVR